MRLHADLVMCYKVVLGLVKLSFADFIAFSPVKPGTHWRQSWIQHGRLCWKSTVSATVDFVADLLPVSLTVDFVASVYRALQSL